MADSFLQFSAKIPKLKKKEKKWITDHLSIFEGDPPEEETEEYDRFCDLIGPYQLQDEDDTLGFDWQFEDDGGLWIHADLAGTPEHVAIFVQMFLQKFRPDDAFAMSWSNTCSRPLVDSHGGGAMFVTAKKIKYNSAWAWAEAEWKKFSEKAGKK